ncbi:MAG: putative toxin-antitoxin system toxin component, PIN family [Chloroflexi bacterium]|nr:putative toxin-antitoxin system toxin component, PIN family [Chloroflexota bacterium]
MADLEELGKSLTCRSTKCISGRQFNAIAQRQTDTVLFSELILNEFRRVLAHKFRIRTEAISNVILPMFPDVEIVEPATFSAQICRAPDDDVILGTAMADNADCIMTGDSDLLVLEC